MSNAKILIVEDDAIIGRHIQAILKKNNYQVCELASSGLEAIQKANEQHPELILMDIQLEGPMDGVETAQAIQASFSVPIIFLTAFADSPTLQRAKITDPFGYVLKPFEERILVTNLEMALNKHSLEQRLRESEEQFRTLVENQDEGLGIINPEGTFTFANPAMETIIGACSEGLIGKRLSAFLAPDSIQIEQEANLRRSLGQKTSYEINILRPDGKLRCLSVTATPWFKDNAFAGSFSLCQDITSRKQVEEAEREQRTLAEALRDTAAALTSSLTLDVVLDRILGNVGRVVPHDGANIMLLEGENLRIVRGSGSLGKLRENFLGSVIPWQRFEFMRNLIHHDESVILGDVKQFGLEKISPRMEWVRSYIVAPIRIKGQTVGILNLGSAVPDFFNQSHAGRLEIFANQAAIAIENARLFEESQQRAHYLSLMVQVTQAAINSTNLETTLAEIARLLADLYQSDGVYITLWEENRKLTIPAAAYGFTAEEYAKIPYNPGDRTLTLACLEAGKPLVAEDVQTSEYVDPELAATFPLKTMIAFPLITADQNLGAILVGYQQTHKVVSAEIEKGIEMASQVALAISKLRLYAEIQRLAIIDDLTGLYNRRGIFELGRQQVEQAHQTGSPLCLIWMDIDQFKKINDNFGHHIGDEVIAVIADRTRNNLKNRDLVGRYGGEGGDELIILVVDALIDEGETVAERLRTVIVNSLIATHDGKIQVTVSLGVTALRGASEDFQELLTRADKAMYEAKAAGRNCIHVQK